MQHVDAIPFEKKARHDYVSEVDRACEAEIVREIKRFYPDHAFLCEESGATGESDFVWVIDPLDGTSNYLHGLPHFAVSIALQISGRTQHAVVYDPIRDELFNASRGSGAFMNNKRMRVSSRNGLEGAVLATAFPFRQRDKLQAYGRVFQSVFGKIEDIRRAGTASLDLACWDLKSQAHDEPLWKTLGGARPNVMAYASLRRLPGGDDAIGELRTMVQAGGFRWACLPLAGNLRDDSAKLMQSRKILASRRGRVELLVDARGMWPGEAIRLLQALEREFDIACVRNVGANGDVLGNARVADSVKAAVCAGGDLGSEADFQPWLHHGAANIIELDLLRLGVTGAQRVAEAAFGFERAVLLRAAPGNLQVHLAAVLPNCMATEAVAMDRQANAIGGDVSFADGRAQAGIRPGLGLHFAEPANSPASEGKK